MLRHTQTLRHIRYTQAALGNLSDRFDFEFFGVTLVCFTERETF